MYGESTRTIAASEDNDSPGPNDFSSSTLAIREVGARGKGVFTTRPIARGTVVIVGKPVSRSRERTWQTVQIGIDNHIRLDLPFELVNHSCDPNCGVKSNRYNAYDLVAMRDIEAEEEITFDYCMTEWTVVGFKKCNCGVDRCRKSVRGAAFLSLEELSAYEGFLASYFHSLLAEQR